MPSTINNWEKRLLVEKFRFNIEMLAMAIGVVEFSREGYKIRKVFV